MSLPTNNLKGALLHLKNYNMEKVDLILHWSKNIINFCRLFTNYDQLKNLLA